MDTEAYKIINQQHEKVLRQIREERRKQNISQEKMAELLDHSIRWYQDLETGRSELSHRQFLMIAYVLNLPFDYFDKSETSKLEKQYNRIIQLLEDILSTINSYLFKYLLNKH